jgi:hypothetical protein
LAGKYLRFVLLWIAWIKKDLMLMLLKLACFSNSSHS